jgi:arabinose-5-phosphate isomerase
MKIINKISIAKKVILSEATALKNIANKLDNNFNLACEAILNCKGKIITIGLGKSGHIATKSAATLSSTGTPSVFLHAAEALHGDIGLIGKLDLVICYSNSGETKELLLLLPLLKLLKITLITITGNKKSMLAKSSDIVLDSSVQSEACPLNLTPTSSVISAIGLSDALAITLLKCRGFTSKDFAKSHPQGELGKRLLKKTEDVMIIKRLPYTYVDMKLIKAIDIITKFNYGIIISLTKEKKLLGIFTDGDLRRTLRKSNDISSLQLYKVMTKKPIVVSKNIMAAEALNIMEHKQITSLVVINDDKTVAGLLTLNQLLKSGIE